MADKQFDQKIKKINKTIEQIEKTVDKLAVATKNGFDKTGADLIDLKKDTHQLKNGQERIELKLDNVAYRFELNELSKRVKILENKVGIKSA